MEAGNLELDVVLLYLGDKQSLDDVSGDVEKSPIIGWLQLEGKAYKFQAAPVDRDESIMKRMALESIQKAFINFPTRLTTENERPGTIKRVASRINNCHTRIIYWDIEEDSEMVRHIMAVPGSEQVQLIWDDQ